MEAQARANLRRRMTHRVLRRQALPIRTNSRYIPRRRLLSGQILIGGTDWEAGYRTVSLHFLQCFHGHSEALEGPALESLLHRRANELSSVGTPQKTAVRMSVTIVVSPRFLRSRAKQAFLVLAMKPMLTILIQDHLVVMVIRVTGAFFARRATVSSPIRCQ